MKKLIFILLFSLSLYSASEKPKFALLNGPTGIGGLKAMKDSKYADFKIISSPDRIIASLIKGEYDIASLPSNLGAIIYNRGLNYKAVAIIVDSGFSLVSRDSSIKSIGDLNGKTVYCAAKGANPDIILQYMLKNNNVKNVNINYSLSYPDLTKALISGIVDTAILAEPFATMALDGNANFKTVIKEFEYMKEPIGILVAKESFLKNNGQLLNNILNEYKSSTEYILKNPNEVLNLIEGSGIIINEKAIVKAMPKIGLSFYTGKNMKDRLKKYYELLYGFNASYIGGSIPNDGFYYID